MRAFVALFFFLLGVFCGLLAGLFLWAPKEKGILEETRTWAREGAEEVARVSEDVKRIRNRIEEWGSRWENPEATRKEASREAEGIPNPGNSPDDPGRGVHEALPGGENKKELSAAEKFLELIQGKPSKETEEGTSGSQKQATGSASSIQNPPIPLGPPPDIHFEETEYDFGEITEGDMEKIEHIYKFKNLGKGVLEIGQIKAGCACTAVLLSKNSVPPGGEGEVKLTFNTARRKGLQRKRLYVYSNDPDESRVQLLASGTIKPIFNVTPSTLYFGDLDKEKLKSKTVKITSASGEPFAIKNLECNEKERFDVQVEELTGNEVGYQLEVTIKEEHSSGKIYDCLKVHTDNARVPVIYVNIFGKILGEMEVQPELLVFGILKDEKEVKKTITVSATQRDDLEIVDVENELDCVICEVVEVEKGKKYEIWVTIDPKPAPENKPSVRDHVTIQTNFKSQPFIKVPVYAYVMRGKEKK